MNQFKNLILNIGKSILDIKIGIGELNKTIKENKPETKILIDLNSIKSDKPILQYFTDNEIKELKESVTPKEGIDYHNINEDRIYTTLKKELIRIIPNETRLKNAFMKSVIKPDVDKKIVSKMIIEAIKAIPPVKAVNKIIENAFDMRQWLKDSNNIALIARGLEKLKGSERLDARKLKNLPRPTEVVYGSSTTISTGTSAKVVDISSQCDGLTSNFVVPAYSGILMVIITGWSPNGVLRPTVDFTTPDSTHISLVTSSVSIPPAGTTLIVLYYE